MATNNNKSRSALGGNPLAQGIFSKTEIQNVPESSPSPESTDNLESSIEIIESRSNNQESIIKNQDLILNNLDSRQNNLDSTAKNQDSRFFNKGDREPVNLRLPIDLNDWLNELLKKGKRRHGSKIPKEIWVQAALELFQAMPVNWEEIDSEESLHSTLFNLESRIKNLD